MSTQKSKIEDVIRRVDATLDTAKMGLADLLGSDKNRRLSGLRNLITFGRSTTFVLQNLRSVLPGNSFDQWYKPVQLALKEDPLMRYFVDARNALEKEGILSVTTSVSFSSFSYDDIYKYTQPPLGAKGFFIGDQLGGCGWLVETTDGVEEKYYVEIPNSIFEIKQHFTNLPGALEPDILNATIEELSIKYIDRLSSLVSDARRNFL